MSPMPESTRTPEPVNPAEYQQFIEKLRAYHEKRGTNFDASPRVGAKNINLLTLWNLVNARGGYDVVSDEKLMWRKLAAEFGFKDSATAAALAFQIKSVYYKFLAAYEISTVWRKEPPPKEILEDQTARGSGLLTRTKENWIPVQPRMADPLGNDADGSGEDGTPSRERNGSEEVPGSGGRATRGLRQAPPQRVLFQPETQPSRANRNTSTPSHTPQGLQNHHDIKQQHQHQSQQSQGHQPTPRGASTTYNPPNADNMSMTVTNYEPRPPMPLTLRSVMTPGNNFVEFNRRRVAAEAIAQGKPAVSRQSGPMLPGSNSTPSALQYLVPQANPFIAGFDGPNIYIRCLCALKSGTPAEQDYALHHLVKISMERGDKYRFESFPGLAEALVEKLLEVGSVFYKVDWNISYVAEDMGGINTINGLDGSPDILDKISRLEKLPIDDNLQSEEFSDTLLQINEAALTMRNMVMLEENAHYVSELHPLRAFLSIALNLPNVDSVVELKHYALDISEQITKYISSDHKDPLYVSLLGQLQSSDRGAILTALRSISRISMNLEENNQLRAVPAQAVQNIINWILLNDEDLSHACLDFLYQYTAITENVEFLLTSVSLEPLISQLSRLLMYNAKITEEFTVGREIRIPAPTELARIPQQLIAELNTLPEPDRSSNWLRCLFEKDPAESITQIALWQAYQARFGSPPDLVHKMLPAAEFIKNVSSTFEEASAQVQQGPVQRFVIKGIRMRHTPVDMKGEEYMKCRWRDASMRAASGYVVCGEYFAAPQDIYRHILKDHLGARELENGKFANVQFTWDNPVVLPCYWDGCQRFSNSSAPSMAALATHLKVHFPPNPSSIAKEQNHYHAPPAKKQKTASYITPAPRHAFQWRSTAMDERREGAGIPLSAVLVLRNLARTIPKTRIEEKTVREGGVSWVERLFKPVEPHLFEVLAHNKAIVSLFPTPFDAYY